MGARFFVVQTLPSSEHVAALHLRRQQFEIFYPTRPIDPGASRRMKKLFGLSPSADVPIISGYVFARFDRDLAHWRSINGTRGVKRILGEAERPTPVPVGFIEEMRDRWAAGGYDRTVEVMPFRYGDKIRITAGSFADRVGEVEAVVEDEVQVVLNMFGRALTVPFKREAIALVS